MTTGHVFIAVSLDGFIARDDGDIDWLMKQPTNGEDHGYDAFMENVDGLIMGRNSFEKVLTFEKWPYDKPVVVLSQTLTEKDIPEELRDKVQISKQAPENVMKSLFAEGWQRAYIDGGKVIQSFLQAHLIADIVITRVPILLGQGIPLFGELEEDRDLEYIETKIFKSGLIQSKYVPIVPTQDV
ncbi:MAG: dihydrofolate reductase [Sneathiella sp.]|nr:dihydrofolate reductase [Sneathiella sp.]